MATCLNFFCLSDSAARRSLSRTHDESPARHKRDFRALVFQLGGFVRRRLVLSHLFPARRPSNLSVKTSYFCSVLLPRVQQAVHRHYSDSSYCHRFMRSFFPILECCCLSSRSSIGCATVSYLRQSERRLHQYTV